MKYFSIHPFRPQYFFPKGFNNHLLFRSFFKPYSLYGKISWFLFNTLPFYRYFFKKSNIEFYIPDKTIKTLLGANVLIAYNKGTIGPEQKITGLGFENGNYFFIKYAQSPLAMINVKNEHDILDQISDLDFVPKIQYFFNENNKILLKTNVFSGNRLDNIPLNIDIIQLLIRLSKVIIKTDQHTKSLLKTSFCHGDFCPWNINIKNNKLLLFDWEMSGINTLGYDLFTYIFQTNFLLIQKKSIKDILLENCEMIEKYFSYFNIIVWSDYLLSFAEKKFYLENNKKNSSMKFQFRNLIDYAKKI